MPQPGGFGRLLFENITIRDLRSDGGSGITVAGFLGDVFIRGVNAVDLEDPFHGVIVVWTDASQQHGAYLYTGADGSLYSTRSVQIEDVNINLPFADRAHVAISGVENVRIKGFNIQGNNTAMALNTTFGSPQMNNRLCVVDGVVTRSTEFIVNGTVDFFLPRPLSQYPGFQSAAKISIWSNVLTNSAIDNMWP